MFDCFKIYQIGNYLFFLGTRNLDGVSLLQVLFQSSSIFVFLFSILFLKEEVQPNKILSLFLVICGVGFVAKDNWTPTEDGSMTSTFWDMIIVLIAAMMWGLYEVLVKVFMPEATDADTNLYLG